MLLFADGAFALVFLGLWIFCIIDVITTPDGAQRNLPKMIWLMIVIILPDVGSIAWLVAGHPWQGQGANLPYKGNPAVRRAPARNSVPSRPDDDQDFLDSLRARAEEQRRRAREAQQAEDDEKGTS